MAVALGTVVVLATWSFCLLGFVSLGLLPTLIVHQGRRTNELLRIAMWWGFLGTLIFTVTVSLWAPLRGPTTVVVAMALLVGTSLASWVMLNRRRPRRPTFSFSVGRSLLVVTVVACSVFFAVAALGPVTNYDSGLYHLGAIRYASEFSAIPGIANLYFPFGYGTTQFTLAGLLANGPLGMESFRLVNGLVLSMAGADLALRLLERKSGPGVYVLAAGMTATWVPMIALSDYWVTSPSQDSTALVLTVVASAYLTDAVFGRRPWLASASVAIVISVSLTLVRPTLGSYLVGVLGVLTFLVMRRRVLLRHLACPMGLSLGAGAIALAVSAARDRILSGWFQYPLSVFAFDVPWRADDPAPARLATLGFHRNPDDLWNSVQGWDWVLPWLATRAAKWETYELLALGVATILVLVWALIQAPARALLPKIVISAAPSALSVVVWWTLTPPSFRFAWGVLFSLFSVPLGWALWSLYRANPQAEKRARGASRDLSFLILAVPVLAVVLFSALWRLELDSTKRSEVILGGAIPVTVTPVEPANVQPIMLESGLEIVQPVDSDQCWSNFPLCTPQPDLRLRPLHQDWPTGIVISR